MKRRRGVGKGKRRGSSREEKNKNEEDKGIK